MNKRKKMLNEYCRMTNLFLQLLVYKKEKKIKEIPLFTYMKISAHAFNSHLKHSCINPFPNDKF